MSSCSASSTAADVDPGVELDRVEPDVGRRGGDQPGIVEQAAGHPPHAQAAQQRRLRARARSAARRRPPGRRAPRTTAAGRARGRSASRTCAAARARPAWSFSASPGSRVSTIIVSRQRELVAVVPAQALADRLGRERERAGRVGEQLDLHAPLRTSAVARASRARGVRPRLSRARERAARTTRRVRSSTCSTTTPPIPPGAACSRPAAAPARRP